MLKVKVVDTELLSRSGMSKAGKPYSFTQQVNIFVEVGGEVRRFPQIIEEGKQPYPAGNYALDVEKHLRINDFGDLIIERYARFQFVPVPVASTAKAA